MKISDQNGKSNKKPITQMKAMQAANSSRQQSYYASKGENEMSSSEEK